jgi:hypothetical protein
VSNRCGALHIAGQGLCCRGSVIGLFIEIGWFTGRESGLSALGYKWGGCTSAEDNSSTMEDIKEAKQEGLNKKDTVTEEKTGEDVKPTDSPVDIPPPGKSLWRERLILCLALFFPLFLATLDTSPLPLLNL